MGLSIVQNDLCFVASLHGIFIFAVFKLALALLAMFGMYGHLCIQLKLLSLPLGVGLFGSHLEPRFHNVVPLDYHDFALTRVVFDALPTWLRSLCCA